MALGDRLGDLVTGMSVNDAIESYLARLGDAGSGAPVASADALARAQSDAVAEIMFLVAAVDGEVADVEIEQLKRSLLELSSVGALSSVDADTLIPALADRLANDGWSARMRAATDAVTAPDVQRLAYRLGVGVALVDDRVEAAETAALDGLAKALDLSDGDAHSILVEVQKTLFG